MPDSDFVFAYAAVPAPTFVCSHENSGRDSAWVHTAGELDIATTPRLERTLCDALAHARLVALDLRDVTFMDSSGVRMIVDSSCRARQCGRRLILLRGPRNVDHMFALTGTADAVETADVDQRAARPIPPATRPRGRA